jgi:hypothetical protein
MSKHTLQFCSIIITYINKMSDQKPQPPGPYNPLGEQLRRDIEAKNEALRVRDEARKAEIEAQRVRDEARNASFDKTVRRPSSSSPLFPVPTSPPGGSYVFIF